MTDINGRKMGWDAKLIVAAAGVVIAGQGWTLNRLANVELEVWRIRTDIAALSNPQPADWFQQRVDRLESRIESCCGRPVARDSSP